MKTENVAVIGAGTMGNGIAHVFALHNYGVCLIDVADDALTKAQEAIAENLNRQVKKEKITQEERDRALANISTLTGIEEGVSNADLVIEAVTEDFEVKQETFNLADIGAPPSAILASNTSSISITKLAAVTNRPERVIGMHFMNPVPMMPLVEIVQGLDTLASVHKHVEEVARQLNKTPVASRDFPGFIANRVLMPMINEAIYTLHEGIAGVQDIDAVMKTGMAHPMGPLQLADFIGLDTCLAIMQVMQQGFGSAKYAPCPLLRQLVDAGKLGAKTGTGFYDWRHNPKHPEVAETFK